MSAADLANDQDRELTVVTAERDDLQLRLDEAEAVIAAVRKVRAWVEVAVDGLLPGVVRRALMHVLSSLDEIDGL